MLKANAACFFRKYQNSLICAKYLHQQHILKSTTLKTCGPNINILYNSVHFKSTIISENPSFWTKWKLKIKEKHFLKTKVSHSAALLYEKCADDIDYSKLFKHFKLPDTFQSWFLLVQLHVWMCIMRIASEEFGKFAKFRLIETMWIDVEIRMGELGPMKKSVKNKNLHEMNEQFRAALISYDEGYFGDDTLLSASVWRTLFSFNCKDPRLIEDMVIYIRKQLSHLDSLTNEDVLYNGRISWLSLKKVLSDSYT